MDSDLESQLRASADACYSAGIIASSRRSAPGCGPSLRPAGTMRRGLLHLLRRSDGVSTGVLLRASEGNHESQCRRAERKEGGKAKHM